MLRFRLIPEGIEALHMGGNDSYLLSLKRVRANTMGIHSIKTLGMHTDYRVSIWALISDFCLQSLSCPLRQL